MRRVILALTILSICSSFAFAEGGVSNKSQSKNAIGRTYVQTKTGLRKAVVNTIIVGEYVGRCEDQLNPSGAGDSYDFFFVPKEVLKGDKQEIFNVRVGFNRTTQNACEVYKKGSAYLLLLERIKNYSSQIGKTPDPEWVYVPVNSESIISLED